ncbi:MAG: hypothetical protein CMM93_01525 [Rickettsiales bacterium]|nr:hypothetical protein [Rickettsiales bacterium]|tara:strand:- start:548 stop:754 length:207 start_codon:yes stop_codon:yes gene_type:complete
MKNSQYKYGVLMIQIGDNWINPDNITRIQGFKDTNGKGRCTVYFVGKEDWLNCECSAEELIERINHNK